VAGSAKIGGDPHAFNGSAMYDMFTFDGNKTLYSRMPLLPGAIHRVAQLSKMPMDRITQVSRLDPSFY
jgi:hypothetical protein